MVNSSDDLLNLKSEPYLHFQKQNKLHQREQRNNLVSPFGFAADSKIEKQLQLYDMRKKFHNKRLSLAIDSVNSSPMPSVKEESV